MSILKNNSLLRKKNLNGKTFCFNKFYKLLTIFGKYTIIDRRFLFMRKIPPKMLQKL